MSEPIDRVNALRTIPLMAGLPHSDFEQLARQLTDEFAPRARV